MNYLDRWLIKEGKFINNNRLYDLKKLFFLNYVDITYIACCAAPGGGRHVVTPRFFRHFTIV